MHAVFLQRLAEQINLVKLKNNKFISDALTQLREGQALPELARRSIHLAVRNLSGA
jgi:hypothetical protein